MKKENEKKDEKVIKTKKVINKKLLLIGILFLLFIIYSILVKFKLFDKLDFKVESFMIGIRNQGLTDFFSVITNLGGAYALIAITLVVVLLSVIKNKFMSFNIMANLTTSFILNELFKRIIRRPRPVSSLLVQASGFSYPSGHTFVGFTFYYFCMVLWCEKIKRKGIKVFIHIITIILILLIAFSRLYLGVHYLSDIIGGFLFGIPYLMLILYLRNKQINQSGDDE